MKSLSRLAYCNTRANKTRSILIIISILLTSMLLTVIATWGYGIVRTSRENADDLYGSYYGSFKGVSVSQLEKMKLRSEFSEMGKLAYTAEVEGKADLFLYAADREALKLTNMDIKLQEGAFPEKEDEIAGSAAFFQNLGYDNPKVGDRITCNYRIDLNSKYAGREFVISGIVKGNRAENYKLASAGYVSEKWYEQLVKEEQRVYEVYFRLEDSIGINSDNAEQILKELAEKCSIEGELVSVNSYYIMWAFDPGIETISVCAIVILLVIIFSVIVIYNIFQVGITQKIWEYGKLKVLGATRKQLKTVILKEGMYLAGVGIPAGLLLGYLTSIFSFQWLYNKMSTIRGEDMIETVPLFSVPLLLIVIFLSLVTVLLALRKPMKIISSISMIEAMRYQESGKRQQGRRKGKRNLNVRGLILANLSGSRKSTIKTICTMGLSCVLFVVMANFVGNMDEEYDARKTVEYGQFLVALDYSLSDAAYPENNLDSILRDNPLNTELIEKIKSLDGVTGVKIRKIFAAKDGDQLMSISVLNREDFNKYAKSRGRLGSFDYDKASDEQAVYFGWSHFLEDYGYTLNQHVRMEIQDKGINIQSPLLGAFGSLNTDWGITEDAFEKLGMNGESTGFIWVDCRQKDVGQIESQLNTLLSDMNHVEISSYQDALQTSRFGIQLMQLGVYAFLTVIGLIGFMNMANTIITGIITRKREFGMLQAVGMTNRQLKHMLQMEGMVFIAGTVLVALIVGTPAGYWLFCYGKNNGWIGMDVYHFPILEIGIMAGAITILQLTLSFILTRNLKKESLIERIRYQG